MVEDFYMDPIMRSRLDKVRKLVKTKDRDWVCVIDGEEGSGKSVISMMIAKYLDPNFNLNNVCFNSEQFIKKLRDSKKNTAIVSDETYSVASARASLSAMNRNLNTVTSEMRQRNLFVIMVIPSFFDLDKTQAIWRCRALIHVYYDKKGDRGRYIIFPKRHKLKLYLNGKKNYSYSKPKSPLPVCKFKNEYVVNEKAYRLKKYESFKARKMATALEMKQKERIKRLIIYLYDEVKLTDEEISTICKIERSMVGKIRRG